MKADRRLQFVNRFHSHAVYLGDYLKIKIIDQGSHLLHSNLLSTVIVGSNQPCLDREHKHGTITSMRELVKHAQICLLKSHGKLKHCLTDGYEFTRYECLRNYQINNNVTELTSAPWDSLLQFVGSDVMWHLLLSTSMYIVIPNTSLVQVNGIPVLELAERNVAAPLLKKRKANHVDSPDIKYKKRQISRTPNEIQFMRQKMFFQQPAFRGKRFLYGLPKSHILHSKPGQIHLMNYIFPRQFGLHNVFTNATNRIVTTFQFQSYMNRETEIMQAAKLKLPSRLQKLLIIMDRMVWLHQRYNYRVRLKCICPLPIMDREPRSNMAQVVANVATASQMPPKEPDESSQFNHNLHEYAISNEQVAHFIKSAVYNVIPLELFGCEENRFRISALIHRCVEMQRFETFTLHDALQGMSVANCDWLTPKSMSVNQKLPLGEHNKRREIFAEFIYWLFDSFIIPLIQVNFYATTGSIDRNKVYYYRMDFWYIISKRVGRMLINKLYEPLDLDDIRARLRNENRILPYTVPRFLPKESGVRIIVNMKRRMTNKDFWRFVGRPIPGRANGLAPSINSSMAIAHEILEMETKRRTELCGGSIACTTHLYEKLKEFKKTAAGRQVYFVKVDVRGAFDHVKHDKLMEIVENALSEETYYMQAYAAVCSTGPALRREYSRKAKTITQYPRLIDFARAFASDSNRPFILVDKSSLMEEDREALLKLLRLHITYHIVKLQNSYYRQTVGIPQGSILSTMLCNLFFAGLERQLDVHDDLEMENENTKSLFVRYVDDFLFMSTSKQKAIGFLAQMHRGNEEFGCYINESKSLVNFDACVDETVFPNLDEGQVLFPWCGYLINTKTLEVMSNYELYCRTDLKFSHTVKTTNEPGAHLRSKLFQRLAPKIHPIFLDTNFNAKSTVLLNIYQTMLIVAMKLHVYILSSEQASGKIKWRPEFIQKTVQNVILGIMPMVRSTMAKFNSEFEIHPIIVNWLCAHAFQKVLRGKKGPYGSDLFTMLKEFKKQVAKLPDKSLLKPAWNAVNPAFSMFASSISLVV